MLVRSIADRMRQADELVKRNMIVDAQMNDEFKRWEIKPGGAGADGSAT